MGRLLLTDSLLNRLKNHCNKNFHNIAILPLRRPGWAASSLCFKDQARARMSAIGRDFTPYIVKLKMGAAIKA
jgi:hypothetical protein